MANNNPIKTYKGYLGTYHMSGHSEYEPQRTNNFEVYIDISKIGALRSAKGIQAISSADAAACITLSTNSFTPPSVNISTIEVKRGNNTIKYAGTPSFPDSSITFNDFIGLNVEQVLMAWQRETYNLVTQAVGLAENYKTNAWVNQYSPDGSVVRQWTIHGVWLSSLQMGDYSSDDNSVRRVTGTLVYDFAIPEDNPFVNFSTLK